jgi:hypothetical protein
MFHTRLKSRPQPDPQDVLLAPSAGYCCVQFEGWSQTAGQRGIGLFSYLDESGVRRFILQHRATDPETSLGNTNTPVDLVSDMHILFCPWCGVSLSQFYRERNRNLDRPELRVGP